MAEIKTSVDRISTKLSESSPTEEMNSAISQTADQITLEVSKTYATQNSLTVYTKIDEVRSRFAMDATSVNVEAGLIKFKSNTIAIESTNFTLDENGNVKARGSFTAAGNGYYTTLRDGSLNMYNDSGSACMQLYRLSGYYGGVIRFIGTKYYSYMTSDGFAIRKMATPGTIGTNDEVLFDANYLGAFTSKSANIGELKCDNLGANKIQGHSVNWVMINGYKCLAQA